MQCEGTMAAGTSGGGKKQEEFAGSRMATYLTAAGA
jgi:hypothetical protein